MHCGCTDYRRWRKDTDVGDAHEEVRDDSYVRPLPLFGLGGRPVQSVQDVLAEGREQAVRHLTTSTPGHGGGRRGRIV